MSNVYYPIPEDIVNDHTCKRYVHFHLGNESPLAEDYCHYEREPDDQDGDGLFYGEWKNVTEEDRHQAQIENKKKHLQELEKEKKKLEAELKALAEEKQDE